MSDNDVIYKTISSITSTKLDELSRAQQSYEKRHADQVAKAELAATKIQKTMALLRGLAEIHGAKIEEKELEDGSDENSPKPTRITGTRDEMRWGNMLEFLRLAERDPSITEDLVDDWQAEVLKDLKQESYKYSHAVLISELITQYSKSESSSLGGGAEPSVDLRDEGINQREEWKKIVFEPVDIDTEKIEKYLDKLFKCDTKTRHALTDLKNSLRNYGESLSLGGDCKMTIAQLKKAATDIPRGTPLPGKKNALFKEISHNTIVANEVLDVLNMRLARLDEWQWPQEGVEVKSRRSLNGKYRMYAEEDILDMLLLYHIGRLWMVRLKSALKAFFRAAWIKPAAKLSATERKNREKYLKDKNVPQFLHSHRSNSYLETFFMSLLPDDYGSNNCGYDDEEDEDDDDDEERGAGQDNDSAGGIKTQLLQLCVLEGQVSSVLERDFAVVQSDFHWYGPSLPLPTMLTVLKYFGIPEQWLSFFSKFLRMPTILDGELRTRARGAPIDHTVSEFLGELILFCLDFSVNRATDGRFLYRMHDDLWIWGTQDVCEKGWASLTQFADIMGLKLNQEKTGSVILGDATSATLPKRGVTWGLLQLDKSTGRFLVNEPKVDKHVEELQFQLDKCDSVLGWIKVWNMYFVKFFSFHFCQPAHCLGRAHIDMVVDVYERIERKLFGNSNVTEYLLGRIKREFSPSHEVPAGVLYLPLRRGGLDLMNPYIPLMAMRATAKRDPVRLLKRAMDLVEISYESAKDRHHNTASQVSADSFGAGLPGSVHHRARKAATANALMSAPVVPVPVAPATAAAAAPAVEIDDSLLERKDDDRDFMTLEEYTRHLEATSPELLRVYKDLQDTVSELHPASLIDESKLLCTAHYKWIFEIYGPAVKKVFGTLRMVDRSSIPLGVLKIHKGKMKWHN